MFFDLGFKQLVNARIPLVLRPRIVPIKQKLLSLRGTQEVQIGDGRAGIFQRAAQHVQVVFEKDFDALQLEKASIEFNLAGYAIGVSSERDVYVVLEIGGGMVNVTQRQLDLKPRAFII